MIRKDNGFDLNIRWRFPGSREYAFAFIALFIFLLIIYANSCKGTWILDDYANIVENKNIFLNTFDWSDIKKTFYGIDGKKIDRPLAYFSFALNYYFDGLNAFGYHIVNFLIHYCAAIFLFLLIYNTLKLPLMRERYSSYSYSIALLATALWASSPLQVTAVTYIVQRMASMAGLFFIMSIYFYLKGRTSYNHWITALCWVLSAMSAIMALGTKENTIMLPFNIWLYDFLLIQGVTRSSIKKNLKLFVPVATIFILIGFWFVDISALLSGEAYKSRSFTLIDRLLTEPRILLFYISLLLYPISSRLTMIHDIELSSSLTSPWCTLPAIAIITTLLVLAVYLARKRPLFSFCIFFYFLNHIIESSFLPLELIFEHRNYIPSMFFFIVFVVLILHIIDYFSYQKAIQLTMVTAFTFLLATQGHTVYARNNLFADPILFWTDNVGKSPKLSMPWNNLGTAYWKQGFFYNACINYSHAFELSRYTNSFYRAVNLHNLGMCHLRTLGDHDQAIVFFKSAIKEHSGFWPSYQYAAECYTRKGDLNEAENILQQAILLWPNNANFHQSISFALLKAGKYDLAAKEALKALLIDPNILDAFRVLGEVYRHSGNENRAIFYWKQYIEARPNDLEGNLALVELYAHQSKIFELNQIIGRLMILKESSDWHMLINRYLNDTRYLAYIPDQKKLIAIIKNNFTKQLQSQSASISNGRRYNDLCERSKE